MPGCFCSPHCVFGFPLGIAPSWTARGALFPVRMPVLRRASFLHRRPSADCDNRCICHTTVSFVAAFSADLHVAATQTNAVAFAPTLEAELESWRRRSELRAESFTRASPGRPMTNLKLPERIALPQNHSKLARHPCTHACLPSGCASSLLCHPPLAPCVQRLHASSSQSLHPITPIV